jgi:hypothetical protein
MSVFFSVQAEADLEGIADYIAADNGKAKATQAGVQGTLPPERVWMGGSIAS